MMVEVKKRPTILMVMGLAIAALLVACGGNQSGAADDNESGAADDTEVSFAGETVTLVLGHSAGGATDLAARELAGHLNRTLPGNPTIEVENRSGGGGAVAGVHFEGRAQPDGLTALFGSGSVPLRYVTGAEGYTHDMSSFRLVAAWGDARTAYANCGVAENVQDVLGLDRSLLNAVQRPGRTAATMETSAQVLGIDLEHVFGYPDSADNHLAVLSGETDATNTPSSFYHEVVKPSVESGETCPLFQLGLYADGDFTADPALDEFPLLGDVYTEITGEDLQDHPDFPTLELIGATNNLGNNLWLPAGTPDDVYEAWIEAVEEAVNSQEYKDELLEVTGVDSEPYVTGSEAQENFQVLLDAPDEMLATLVE